MALALLLLSLVFSPTSPVLAADFTVNSETDAGDASPGDGQCLSAANECTLRAAVEEANALEGQDLISLPAGDYVLSKGTLDLTSELILTGEGQKITRLSCSGDHRGLDLFSWGPPWGHISIRHLTVENCANGVANDWNDTVLFDTVAIQNNTNTGLEIYPIGAKTIIRYSTFSGNSTAYEGGAIDHGGGDLIIESSTFFDNSNVLEAGRGGAIRVHGARAAITNSTFSSNTSINEGGAVHAEIYSTVEIRNCTFFDNNAHFLSSDLGSYYDSTIVVSNSIFTGGCEGQVVSAGNNLDETGVCGLKGPGDLVGMNASLGPLTNNGGRTLTHMPNAGSPAIDAGNNALATGDYEQRGPGYPRIFNSTVDIGSVEWGIIFQDSFEQLR